MARVHATHLGRASEHDHTRVDVQHLNATAQHGDRLIPEDVAADDEERCVCKPEGIPHDLGAPPPRGRMVWAFVKDEEPRSNIEQVQDFRLEPLLRSTPRPARVPDDPRDTRYPQPTEVDGSPVPGPLPLAPSI